MGVLLEIIATISDEIITGHLFADGTFAAVNLVEPYLYFEEFLAYLVCVGAALIVREQGAGDRKKMSEIFSQTLIECGMVALFLTLLYVLFTPGLVRFVADDPSVIKQCDRIIVLDKGHIIEDGTYEELMKNNGYFTELVERQQIGADLMMH